MTQTSTNQNRTITPEIETFILWFLDQEIIPVQIRRDLCAHLMEKGTLDEDGYLFLEQASAALLIQSEAKEAELKARVEALQADLAYESNPETSVQTRVAKQAGEELAEIAEDYVTDINEYESAVRHNKEKGEETENADVIANLKANLE